MSSGSLPAGISLSPAGNLSGTPTATGTFSFTVKVTDTNGQSATEATSISVSAGVSTTFSAPPAAVVGTAYTDTLTAAGGTTPYTWSVNAGSLPPGLTLSSAGVLAGTPTTAGNYPFTVNVIDKNNGIATASVTLVVGAGLSLTFGTPPGGVVPTTPPGGVVGTAYIDTLTAAGGTAPYTWSVSAGTLPAGITLNASTGVLAGTPTAGGTANFTIKVTDAAGQTATFATSIVVLAGALTIVQSASVATTTPGGTVGYTIKVTNTGQTVLTGATFTDPLSGVLDNAGYNSDAAATAGTVSFASPNLTWTGTLAVGVDGDHHVLGDGEQSGHREQEAGQHDHVDDVGQQLRGRQHRSQLHPQRPGVDADHHRDRQRLDGHARYDGRLYDHGDELRSGGLRRGRVH